MATIIVMDDNMCAKLLELISKKTHRKIKNFQLDKLSKQVIVQFYDNTETIYNIITQRHNVAQRNRFMSTGDITSTIILPEDIVDLVCFNESPTIVRAQPQTSYLDNFFKGNKQVTMTLRI